MTALPESPVGPLLPKAPTGVRGLDEITGGGLPRGRCTLVTGGTGCGKTLLGLQFLVAGARECGEPGVLITFEESAEEVAANVASLGFDLDGLQRDGLLAVYAFRAEPKFYLFKGREVTAMATVLAGEDIESAMGVSSRADTWLVLHNVESNGKRRRLLSVLKSRGTAHSDQVREFALTDHGVKLVGVSGGPAGVMTGPAGLTQTDRERRG